MLRLFLSQALYTIVGISLAYPCVRHQDQGSPFQRRSVKRTCIHEDSGECEIWEFPITTTSRLKGKLDDNLEKSPELYDVIIEHLPLIYFVESLGHMNYNTDLIFQAELIDRMSVTQCDSTVRIQEYLYHPE